MNKQLQAATDLIVGSYKVRDEDGYILPQDTWTKSGNGLTYLTVYICLLSELLGRDFIEYEKYDDLVRACLKGGVLMRTPENEFGLNSHDDYMSAAVGCIITGNTAIPRAILWHGFLHLGMYNNTDKFTWDAWLWRFPQVWFLMWPAAFPWMKWPLFPALYLLSRFMNLAALGGSATQLIWIYHCGVKYLGFNIEKFDRVTALLPAAFKDYYSKNHCFIAAAEAIQPKELNNV